MEVPEGKGQRGELASLPEIALCMHKGNCLDTALRGFMESSPPVELAGSERQLWRGIGTE